MSGGKSINESVIFTFLQTRQNSTGLLPLSSPSTARPALLGPVHPSVPGAEPSPAGRPPTSPPTHGWGPSRSCCRAHRATDCVNRVPGAEAAPGPQPPLAAQQAPAPTRYHLVKAGLGLRVPQQRFGSEDDQLEGKHVPSCQLPPGQAPGLPRVAEAETRAGSSPACGRAAGSAGAARGSSWPAWSS